MLPHCNVAHCLIENSRHNSTITYNIDLINKENRVGGYIVKSITTSSLIRIIPSHISIYRECSNLELIPYLWMLNTSITIPHPSNLVFINVIISNNFYLHLNMDMEELYLRIFQLNILRYIV